MAFSKYVITNAGRNLMLDCMESGDFQIEKLVLGSGRYGGILTEIENVVEPVLEFSGDTLTVNRRGEQLEVRCRLTNEQLDQGFEWREYGLYATDGNKTVLFCYDNAGENPVPVSSASTGAALSNTIKVIIAVDEAATVNVEFQPDAEIIVDDVVTPDGVNPVTGAAVAAYAATTALYSLTIPVEGWNDAAPYSAVVEVPGILETDAPFAYVANSGDEAEMDAWACVTGIETGNGSITAYATNEKPALAIQIQLRVVR